MYSGFDPTAFRRSGIEVDRDKVKTLRHPLSDVFFTLQTFLGSYYINDFNLYGRTFRVQAQAEAARARQPGRRQPLLRAQCQRRTWCRCRTVVTAEADQRSGVFPALQHLPRRHHQRRRGARLQLRPGGAGDGGDSRNDAARRLQLRVDRRDYQEKKTGGQTGYIFALSLLFVFLVLAALYESWAMPVAILLVIPFGVFGAFLGLLLREFDNNVYTQIGSIMLIGLAAKNAILIVEFAKLARERGTAIVERRAQARAMRLRPILMTSFAFILGTVPLAIATGAGAGARQALGTRSCSACCSPRWSAMFFIPVFYVVLQRVSERQVAVSARR